VEKLDEVEKIDTMVLFMDQDKATSFATLIPPIYFIILDKFNDTVGCGT
jgi:hypothetical protein